MTEKLEHFIKRNRRRNSHLYLPGLIEGDDFVVCPASQERLSMIKSSYIQKILGMTVDEYDQKYPGIQKICNARKKNISAGLQTIDSVSGLTRYQFSQAKARQTLKQTDASGMSGYKKKGQKTRATHMSNIDEFGRNGYQQQANYRLTTVLPNGLTIEQNAHNKQKETLIKSHKTGTGGASKISKKVLKPIIDYLDENNIKYYFDLCEYGIKDPDTGNYYFYDLTVTGFNITIEYQSSAWHANPLWNEIRLNNWKTPRGKKKSANESIEYDINKAHALLKHRDIKTYYVWEDSAESDVERLLCLLKTMNTKY
jgi:hypothetical protein